MLARSPETWLDEVVAGAVVIVVVLLLFPVALAIVGGVIAASLGWFVKDDVDTTYAGSEYLDLGR
jgi:hypothetical protein